MRSNARVALPTEGVDRNHHNTAQLTICPVALPTEGVDRNFTVRPSWARAYVALPTEGVDRNLYLIKILILHLESPSPRRAWIEIAWLPVLFLWASVALPTEGVDRNIPILLRAYITIVALPTEGVDRNGIEGV